MKSFLVRMRSTGKPSPRVGFSHMAWAFLGAFLGILAIERIGFWLELSGFGYLFLIGSFGASAVLLYGVPMAEFSQPRNVIGGHVISALVGVSLYQIFGAESIWVCPLAVSLAIFAQQFTRTVHPPGGATALIAVIGGDSIHQIGFIYPLFPVLAGSTIMVMIAVMINNLSKAPNRKYPTYWW